MDLYKAGRYAEAQSSYEAAIQQKPDYVPCYLNLSLACLKRGKVDDAVHAMEKAVALASTTGAVHYHYGNALNAKGRWNEAVTEYARAFEMDKAQVNGLLLAAALCADHGVAAKAKELAKAFLAAAPADHPRRAEAEQMAGGGGSSLIQRY